jgi:negative regulator of sigma E activity
MSALLTFASGPWGALLQKAMLALMIAGTIWIAVSQYNDHIAKGQMLRDQNAQLVQLQKDNQEVNQKLSNLQIENNKILEKLDQKNNKVIETHDRVSTYIRSPEARKSNRESSDVIKKTIGMLQNDE